MVTAKPIDNGGYGRWTLVAMVAGHLQYCYLLTVDMLLFQMSDLLNLVLLMSNDLLF